MRGIQIVFGLLAASIFAACGGGGSGSLGGSTSPTVAGRIVSRDGSTVNLAGVVVECVESGESDVSDGDGHFEVDAPRGESFRLKVDDPVGTKGEGEGDCSEGGDGDADEQDVKGDEVEIGALKDGEFCDVEITIENGEIVCINVSKGDGKHDDGGKRTGESRLVAPEGQPGFGEVEVGVAGECSWMEVEVGGLLPETSYEVVLVGEGVHWPVGPLATNAEGEAHLAIESCGGDRPLPFGVASVAELAGLTLLVTDSLGAAVLEGVVPEVGSEDHHDGKDKDDGVGDGKDGDDGDGDGKDGDDGDGDGDDGKDGDDGDGDDDDGDDGDDGEDGIKD
jgi:hypothetical protein